MIIILKKNLWLGVDKSCPTCHNGYIINNYREKMTKIEREQIKDMIDYHIDYSDSRGQGPNVWIMMIYLDDNYSHILEYWNQPQFRK